MKVKEIKVKDYLTKSKLDDFCINPYVGCPHACRYCYACFMKRFSGHDEKWGEFVDVKICDKPIDLDKIKGKTLFLSSVTDCYNPLEIKYEVTRKIISQLTNCDADVQISTKNRLILRDLDLLKQIKKLTVAMSVNTLDEGFSRDMDRASSISDRLKTLQTLHENGIKTVLFMSPIFVGITDYRAIIEKTRPYIDEYWFEDLNLRGGYKADILDYIQRKHPHLYNTYYQIYVKNDRTKLIENDAAIKKYALENNIPFKDYFHHQEVIESKTLKSQ